MKARKIKKIKILILLILTLLNNGCKEITLMNSKGQIGVEQSSLILVSFLLMLIVVIPTIIMVLFFVVRYRSSNIYAEYCPEWCNSKKVECLIWSIPTGIIFLLSFITLSSTYKLDPKNMIQLSKGQGITIEVVSLDWKWLFIYPSYGIATVNKVVFPSNVPIHFKITSGSVMNSFFIPKLGSQIYAMHGMKTDLNLIANEPGEYNGISSNFSGRGFSNMKFSVTATRNKESFFAWIKETKKSKNKLCTMQDYRKISVPSNLNKIQKFSSVKEDLFSDIIKEHWN